MGPPHSAPKPPTRVAVAIVSLSIVASGIALRVWLLQSGVVVSPDGRAYLKYAQNLQQHLCYSAADPASGSCEPTWGYQPPGYPAAIAAFTAVAGNTATAVAIGQIALLGAALGYLLWVTARLIPLAPLAAAGMLVAISPNTIGWSKWILTETLSAAAGLWVLAECLHALSTRTVPVRRVAAAMAAASVVRWDMTWVALLFAIVAVHVSPWTIAVKRTGMAVALSGIPYALLILRAAVVGLPLVPSAMPPPEEVPPGVQAFWQSTALTQESAPSLVWPVWERKYSRIESAFDRHAFLIETEGPELGEAVRGLSAVPNGQSIPPEVDGAFAALAEPPWIGTTHWLRLWWGRVLHLWGDHDRINKLGFLEMHGRVSGELLEAAARWERLLLLLASLLSWPFLRSSMSRTVLGGITAVVLFRTMFLVAMTALEQRYLSPLVPMMGFGLVISWAIDRRAVHSSAPPPGRAMPDNRSAPRAAMPAPRTSRRVSRRSISATTTCARRTSRSTPRMRAR